jgi:ABC-type multidrug transport system fused ATPase/permease subunit
LLCGDAISNFKTVQSLGNTDLIVDKYEELLEPAKKAGKSHQIKAGLAFGFSQGSLFIVFAVMFWGAGWLLDIYTVDGK